MTTQRMTLNDHNRNEYARMAAAAARVGRHDVAATMNAAASCSTMELAAYDAVASLYRAWLVSNELPARPEAR